jgi:hypothetical protein
MRFFGSTRAFLVVLFIAVFGAFGPAIDGSVVQSITPELETYLDYETKTFTVTATGGIPETIGVINFVVVSTPEPMVLGVPFLFDSSGGATFSIPLDELNNGLDLVVGIQLFTLDFDYNLVVSRVWALTTRNYTITDPSNPPCPTCPLSPGGWVEWVNWPGVQNGPVYPHTIVAVQSSEERLGSQPMLALESGPAGSFPIN